ncbi:hypothetical protein Tco_0250619, partial [Tanacetum coccineum]
SETKLLRHVGIVASGSTFDDALSAFNTSMEIDFLSNPSEIAAPKLMKKKADIYFTWDTLTDICYRFGISFGKEVNIGLGRERDKSLRPVDVLLYSWDVGRNAAQRKRVKYEAKCADIGYDFLPFSFSSFGELEKDAVTLLKRIQKFSMAQDIGARADVHIFNRISFSITEGVGAQIVSRFPSNLL